MKSISKLGLLSVSAAAILLPTAADAGGFYLQEQSVRAIGRAFSGETADTGAASLWWNPAAIAGQPSQAYGGLTAILPRARVNDTGTTITRLGGVPVPVGGDPTVHNPINKGFLPSGAASFALSDTLAFGVSITSPFSFTTNYDSGDWSRYLGNESRLRTFDVQPSVGWQPLPWLRLGAGVNVEYTTATLTAQLPQVFSGPDGFDKLKGDGFDVGYSLGAQMVSDRVTFGIAYKSSIKHHLAGDITIEGLTFPAGVNGKEKAKASFSTPWQLTASFRVKATDKLTLDVQGGRFGWSKFDAIRTNIAAQPVIPQNYRNSWNIAGGFDYDLTPAWTVRGGVQYDQTPTQNGQRDTRVPDTDRYIFALGASHKLNDKMTIDAGGSYVKFDKGRIDRDYTTPTLAFIDTSGEVKAHALVFALGGRYIF